MYGKTPAFVLSKCYDTSTFRETILLKIFRSYYTFGTVKFIKNLYTWISKYWFIYIWAIFLLAIINVTTFRFFYYFRMVGNPKNSKYSDNLRRDKAVEIGRVGRSSNINIQTWCSFRILCPSTFSTQFTC